MSYTESVNYVICARRNSGQPADAVT